MAGVSGSRSFDIAGDALWAVVADPARGMDETFDRLASMIVS